MSTLNVNAIGGVAARAVRNFGGPATGSALQRDFPIRQMRPTFTLRQRLAKSGKQQRLPHCSHTPSGSTSAQFCQLTLLRVTDYLILEVTLTDGITGWR